MPCRCDMCWEISWTCLCFSDMSQTLRSEFDITPELLRQTLGMRKSTVSNGETMCGCVNMGVWRKMETGDVGGQIVYHRRVYRNVGRTVMVMWCQYYRVYNNCKPKVENSVTLISLIMYQYLICCCVTGFTSSPGDYREKEDMYDEIIRLKKVEDLFNKTYESSYSWICFFYISRWKTTAKTLSVVISECKSLLFLFLKKMWA